MRAVDLPEYLRPLAEAWGFVATEELAGGHCSRVFANDTLVLKAPFQGEELVSGVDAVLALQHAGGPTVFRYDRPTAAVLMERLKPGTNLSDPERGLMVINYLS